MSLNILTSSNANDYLVGETLTMDEDYQRERAIRKQKKAQHVGEGFVYGITDFGIGLYKGITGVVVRTSVAFISTSPTNFTSLDWADQRSQTRRHWILEGSWPWFDRCRVEAHSWSDRSRQQNDWRYQEHNDNVRRQG